MHRRTKIVATLGPATSDYETIKKLIEAGANVARINCSHSSHDAHRAVIENVKRVRRELGQPVAIMLDTKGPEIRTGVHDDIHVKKGMKVRLVKQIEKEGDIPINPDFVLDQFEQSVQVLFDDGYVSSFVTDLGKGFVEVEIFNDGVIKNRKSINVPSILFDLPDLTEQDIQDIKFGCEMNVEMIAASFINTSKQVLAIKELLHEHKSDSTMVISKIESKQGVVNFEEILEVSDGIMVARGDLGVEMSVKFVPGLQKKIIKSCNSRSKIVITATQMLESMIKSPTPTRAEASDVANAVFDATSAVMLSGETAMGKYPIQAVKMMAEIICEAERDFEYLQYFQNDNQIELHNVPTAMARAAVNTSYSIEASAIIACTRGGYTVRRLSRFKPKALIIAVTPSERTFHQTSVMWGTVACMEKKADIEREFSVIACTALQNDWVDYGDHVVLTNGKPYGISFTTNAIHVRSIGEVLVKGRAMNMAESEDYVEGEVDFLLVHNAESKAEFKGKIVGAVRIEKEDINVLKQSAGIVLQNHPLDEYSIEILEELYTKYSVPYIHHADGAMFLMTKGEKVRLHLHSGHVFKGGSLTEEEMRSKCTL